MDLAADVAEQALDRGVDVLVGLVELVDRVASASRTSASSASSRMPGRLEPLGVDQRPLEVVRQQLVVLRAQELPHLRRERARRPVPPRASQRMHLEPLVEASIVSAMSFTCTASWPIRSRGGERGRAPLHAQPLGVVGDASPRVSRIV